jgi:Copper transport outer membrane protein, MctB
VFDYRYHALSLAAVLLALAVGIVIGVAIGDSNLVSSAKSGIVRDLSSEVGTAQRQTAQLRSQLSAEEAFTNALYPIAVHGLLGNRQVGLVFLGNVSDQIQGLVRDAVSQAGGNVAAVFALREPPDLAGLARSAAGTPYAAVSEPSGSANTPLLERFAQIAGRELVAGGQAISTSLLARTSGRLLSAFDGAPGRLEGVIVSRAEPAGMPAESVHVAGVLESGIVRGFTAAKVPAVGVELTTTEPSQVPWYQGQGISSVDDLSTTAGKAALAYALAGFRGSYGVKGTANSLLPAVVAASGHA